VGAERDVVLGLGASPSPTTTTPSAIDRTRLPQRTSIP